MIKRFDAQTETHLAPDFELTDTNNSPVCLQNYRSKAVVLVLARGFA